LKFPAVSLIAHERDRRRVAPLSDLIRNAGGLAASRFAAAIASLIAVPVIIHHLGLVAFGTWELLVAVASLSTVVTGPLSGTLLWRMSLAWGQGDATVLRRLVRAGLVAGVLVTAVLIPATLLGGGAVSRLVHASASQADLVQALLFGLVLLTALTVTNDTLGALNSAAQRVRVTSLAQTTGQITMHSVCVVSLTLGIGLPAMLLGMLAGQLTTCAILLLGVRRSLAGLNPTSSSPPIARGETKRYFALLTVGSLSALLRGQTDRIVLAWLASPVWVGYYGVAARLANLVMEVNNLFYVPTIAAAGALVGARRWGAVRALFRTTMTMVTAGGAVLGIVLIGAPELLLLLWLGTAAPEAAFVLRILSAGTLTAVMLTGPGTAICKGSGAPGRETQYVIVSLLLNLVLTVVLTTVIGPIGTVIASSVSWSIGAAYFAFVLCPTFRLPKAPARRAAVTLAAVAVAALTVATMLRVMPAVTTRAGAVCGLLGLLVLGLAVVAVLGRWTGGLTVADVLRLVNVAGTVVRPPDRRHDVAAHSTVDSTESAPARRAARLDSSSGLPASAAPLLEGGESWR
jgi:O-antigen/teichoic acid export membrane protein